MVFLVKKCYETPPKEVSERMRKVKSKNTCIEKRMEEILKNLKIGYVKHPKLAGNPDFKIKGENVLIFCDGSFWHGRREREISGEAFSRNKEFWMQKLRYNKKRDERNNRVLRKQGWSVHRFWDDDILSNPDKIINRLRSVLDAKRK